MMLLFRKPEGMLPRECFLLSHLSKKNLSLGESYLSVYWRLCCSLLLALGLLF